MFYPVICSSVDLFVHVSVGSRWLEGQRPRRPMSFAICIVLTGIQALRLGFEPQEWHLSLQIQMGGKGRVKVEGVRRGEISAYVNA